MKFSHYLLLVVCVCMSFFSKAQSASDSIQKNYLIVYLDGGYGYQDYIKTEINFVNYVRDRYDAQVHILITAQQTGSGGTDFTIFLLGQKEFDNKNDTLHYVAYTNNTNDETRAGLVQQLKMGLLPYVAKLTSPPDIKISFTATTAQEKEIADKWDSWVYSIGANGNGNFDNIYKSISGGVNIAADRVTDAWKLDFSFGMRTNKSTYDLGDDGIYEYINNSRRGEATAVKSLTDHWSAGGVASYHYNTYSNQQLYVSVAPAVEYDIFPYSSSTSKLLTFFYKIEPSYTQYIDTTIFGKTDELLLAQSLDISLSLQQKWGSISTGISGSNYFYDFSKNAFSIFTSLNWKVFEGLSIDGFISFDIIHDQINLPKAGASNEDILVQQQELAHNFSLYSYVGISYSFGSIYNNVVNPRFQGGSFSFYY